MQNRHEAEAEAAKSLAALKTLELSKARSLAEDAKNLYDESKAVGDAASATMEGEQAKAEAAAAAAVQAEKDGAAA